MQKIRAIFDGVEKILRGPFLWVLAIIVVYASVLAPIVIQERVEPGSTMYGFPTSYLQDYFQYIYEIKSGQQGKFLFHNVYSTDPTPVMVLEPHYNVIGFLSRPLKISPFEAYFIARFVAIGLLTFMMLMVVSRITENGWSRLGMVVMVIFSTSFWQVESGRVNDPITYSNYFNVFTKFNNTQLHHYLAIACLMILLLHLVRPSSGWRSLATTAGITIIFGFLHPFDAIYMAVVWGFHFVISSIVHRRIDRVLLLHLLIFIIVMAPIMAYYTYLLFYVWRNTLEMFTLFAVSSPLVPFLTYMQAFGPVLFLALPALFIVDMYKHPLKRLVMLWAFIPIVLFLFSYIGIQISCIRIFQTFQLIPMSLTAGMVLEWICKKIHISLIPVVIVVSIGFIAYAMPNYILQLRWFTSPDQPYFIMYTLIQKMNPTLTYLAKNVPPNSVVLAPEKTSSLVPDFTDDGIVVGHPGTNPNYNSKMLDMEAFLGGYVSAENVLPMLNKYHVSYIIFGAESPTFESLPYTSLPYLKEVFRDGSISVVSVNH